MLSLPALIDLFALHCRARALSVRTVGWYLANLAAFAHFCGGREWSGGDVVESFVASLLSRRECYLGHPRVPVRCGPLSVATVRGYIRTLRRFFRWCVETGRLTSDPSARLRAPRLPRMIPRGIEPEDFDALFRVAVSARDRALLLFLLDTGCRASEVCAVRLRDVDLRGRIVVVLGKGKQERFVFLSPRTHDALVEWIEERGQREADWLFLSKRGQFSSSTIALMLNRLKARAGVRGRCNPHAFRHGFARVYLMRGGDLASLSQMLGHADVATTMIYSSLAMADLQAKHRAFSPVMDH